MLRRVLPYLSIWLLISSQLEAESTNHKIALLQQKVSQLSERVEGLTTVIEGLNSTINELRVSKKSNTADDISLIKLKIDRLNKECIKRKNFVEKKSSFSSNISTRKESSEKVEKSNSTLYREGAQFFQKQQYEKAKDRFTLMVDRNYKRASSSYYLGEIAYYTKNYSDAIYYFKKSAKIYDKASYIDTLLLHTAISLDKSGDKEQAKIFYQTVIDDYPKKRSSKIAQNNLDKL